MRRLVRLVVPVMVSLAAFAWGIHPTAAQSPSCFVATTQGDVQGLDHGASCAFFGIPFAAPPVGSLRWKAPQTAAPWAPDVLLATTAPLTCAQLNVANGLPQGSEEPAKSEQRRFG